MDQPIRRQAWWRDILFDTLEVPSTGRVDDIVFCDHTKFKDGRNKMPGLHTNMTQAGQLGTPREFLVISWGVAFEEWADPEDIRTIRKNLGLRLVFGGDTTMQGSALSTFVPTMVVTDGLASKVIEGGYTLDSAVEDWVKFNRKVEAYLKLASESGVWTHFFRSVVSITGKPLHLESTTSFRVEAKMSPVDLKGPSSMKVILSGMDLKYGSPPW